MVYIKVSLKAIKSMAKDNLDGITGNFILESGKVVKDMELVSGRQIIKATMERGIMILPSVMEFIHLEIIANMKDSFIILRSMEKVYKHFKMEINMKENIYKVKLMDRENIHGKME